MIINRAFLQLFSEVLFVTAMQNGLAQQFPARKPHADLVITKVVAVGNFQLSIPVDSTIITSSGTVDGIHFEWMSLRGGSFKDAFMRHLAEARAMRTYKGRDNALIHQYQWDAQKRLGMLYTSNAELPGGYLEIWQDCGNDVLVAGLYTEPEETEVTVLHVKALLDSFKLLNGHLRSTQGIGIGSGVLNHEFGKADNALTEFSLPFHGLERSSDQLIRLTISTGVSHEIIPLKLLSESDHDDVWMSKMLGPDAKITLLRHGMRQVSGFAGEEVVEVWMGRQEDHHDEASEYQEHGRFEASGKVDDPLHPYLSINLDPKKVPGAVPPQEPLITWEDILDSASFNPLTNQSTSTPN